MTVVIPLRVSEMRLDLFERIRNFCADAEIPNTVSVLVVDDGSKAAYFDKLKQITSEAGIGLVSTGSDHSVPFNIALCRNVGAQHANGELILFMDADLIPYPGFFNDIFCEAELIRLHERATGFLMCPVIYLTEVGYEKYKNLPTQLRLPYCINSLLRADWGIVDKYSSGTSAIVVRKDYYLQLGGNDTQFSGWGFEDYEFTNRLVRRFRQFSMPRDWLWMGGNFMRINEFRGWKSVYRLHGDWLAQKGIWLVHAPHAVGETDPDSSSKNWELLTKKMREDVAGTRAITALPDLTIGKSLFFAKNPFCYSEMIAPFFGEAVFALDKEFKSGTELENFIREHSIKRVVLANPYKSETSKFVYIWCRENAFPYYVCERGALPDSVYHDPTGFLNDGTSYNPPKWDRELSDKELVKTTEYIKCLKASTKSLEKQGPRKDVGTLRNELGLKSGKKVLFVPFQQPNDTVIREFSGAIKSFERFHELVSNLVDRLGEDWTIVYKKHPSEDSVETIIGAIRADNINVYDLLEISDAILVINSSVGLLGMIFDKPVYIVGDSWYSDARINVPVQDLDTLPDKIRAGFSPDYGLVLRFVHYLRFEFYSFGNQHQRKVRYADGSPITATGKIDYYELRGICKRPLFFETFEKPISRESPMYDRYKNESPNQLSIRKVLTGAVRIRLIKKLRSNPKAFFKDSRYIFLRPISFFFR